jgi:hypothetical protein
MHVHVLYVHALPRCALLRVRDRREGEGEGRKGRGGEMKEKMRGGR